MFTYSPLDEGKSEIRLVRFVPEKSDAAVYPAAPIRLELKHAIVDDALTHYAALSYVWGEATDTVPIYINDVPHPIGRNLHAALTQLRQNQGTESTSSPSWLWVDSICIQQSDVEEKTHQVDLMRIIYGQADLVFVWLGPGTEESDVAMDFICRNGPVALDAGVLDMGNRDWEQVQSFTKLIYSLVGDPFDKVSDKASQDVLVQRVLDNGAQQELVDFLVNLRNDEDVYYEGDLDKSINPDPPSPGPSKQLVLGVQNIMTRDYWHRVWIVQEVALAQHAVLLCGTKHISLDAFEAAMTLVGYINTSPAQSGLSGIFYECIALKTRKQYRNHGVRPDLGNILVQTAAPPGRPFYSASDPRDLIFGLLGIVKDAGELGLQADYKMSVAEVFTNAMRTLIRDADDGEGWINLDFCTPRPEDDLQYNKLDLPTWVCDWQHFGKYGLRNRPIRMSKRFNAGGPPRKSMSTDSQALDRRILCRSGCRVDVITEVMEPPEWYKSGEWGIEFPHDSLEWLSSVAQFAGLGPDVGPAEDYVWRTISLDGLLDHYSDGERVEFDDRDLPEVEPLIRRILRQLPIDPESLTPAQLRFIKTGWLSYTRDRPEDDLHKQIRNVGKNWSFSLQCSIRGRTLFKTANGRLGLGHVAIRPGDIVTLLWGLESPIVLRTKDKGLCTFVGDAYVDGIMSGEGLHAESVREEGFWIR